LRISIDGPLPHRAGDLPPADRFRILLPGLVALISLPAVKLRTAGPYPFRCRVSFEARLVEEGRNRWTSPGCEGQRSGNRYGIGRSVGLALSVAALCLLGPTALSAQLQPYDPLEWTIFDREVSVVAAGGGAVFFGQRASLAGTEGRLIEAGLLRAFIRTGRVALEGAGTVRRFFVDGRRFAPAHGGAGDAKDGRRRDSGDYRIATTVRLTPLGRPGLVALRFGTRLPTTDNRVGLERDATDFFAMVGGRLDRGPARAMAELGVGIHTTREADYEQSDVLTYAFGAVYGGGRIQPALWIVGFADGLPGRSIRGNEELAEVRLQLRSGGRRWIQIAAVRGLTAFSPDVGVVATVGATR